MKKISIEINVPDGLADYYENNYRFRNFLEFAVEGQLLIWNLEKKEPQEILSEVKKRVELLGAKDLSKLH